MTFDHLLNNQINKIYKYTKYKTYRIYKMVEERPHLGLLIKINGMEYE